MNELIELGLVVAETKAPNHGDLRDGELIELGLVVAETKGHCHGTLPDAGPCYTTSPPY